jgi:hypothetical protein
MRAVFAFAVGVIVLAPTGGLAAPAVTKIVFVAPVDRTGRPLPSDVVTKTVRGGCEAGSDVVAGPVYRCFTAPFKGYPGGAVADPCMAAVYGRTPTDTVLCMELPWSPDVLRILTKGLPKSPGPFSRNLVFPLGVQLTTGQDCLAAQGAHDTYRDRVVDYYCRGRPTLELLRGVHKAHEPWTFDSLIETASGRRVAPPVSVAVAWFEGWRPPA